MKKLLTIAALASAVAAYATETISVGTVGVTKITTYATDTVVVTSYNELDGTGDMAVSNIVKTANLPTGTKLYALSGVNAYEGYTLTELNPGTVGTPKYWQKDLNYTVNNVGAMSDPVESTSPNVNTLSVGKGFWISFPAETSFPQNVIVYGLPPAPASSNVTVTAKSTALVGNMTQGNKAPTITNMVTGDSIMLFGTGSSNTGKLTTYSYSSKEGKEGWKNWSDNTTSSTPPVIPAGTGFWYISKGNSNVSIQW